jgi:integrase
MGRTVTATYVKRGSRYRVIIRPQGGSRITRAVPTREDARALVQHFNNLGLQGITITPQVPKPVPGSAAPSYPAIREALPPFLDQLVAIKELRASTASAYKNRLANWAYDLFGDTPWNEVTRDQIGAALIRARDAKKSAAVLEQIRCPLTRFYQWQVNMHRYTGVNPAGDLRFFLGKQPGKRNRKRDTQWFREDEASILMQACQALRPRWHAFLAVCFGGGLRWGEATALYRNDLDVRRERVHIQRTWSEDGGRIEACKDGEDRWVKLPPSTIAALRAHLEAMALEASVKDWSAEQRQLVFPNTVGRVTRYGYFLEGMWQPLLKATRLPYRKPHAMRHSYAAWLLERKVDLRYVKEQMGHASIDETEGTYGHLVPERHESVVAQLDEFLSP